MLRRTTSAVALVLTLGACVVHVSDAPPVPASPSPSPPPPSPPARAAAAPAPNPVPSPAHGTPPPAHVVVPVHPGGAPTAAPAAQFVRFPARVVHPPPLDNARTGRLDVAALRLRLRPNRKCGPRESTPGHWIHVDCGHYRPLTHAKKFNPRKLRLMLAGMLKLDDPVGRHPGEGPHGIRGTFGAGGADGGASVVDAGPSATDAGAAILDAGPGAIDGGAAIVDAGGGSNSADGGAPPPPPIPDGVDHRKDGTEGPVKDQGQVGSCTAFSLSSAMDNGIRRQNKPDTTSSLHVWSHYGYPGMAQAGDGNTNKEIVAWEQWPYDERTACEIMDGAYADCGPFDPPVTPGSASSDAKLQAKIKDEDGKGKWHISEYDDIPADADTIAQMLATGADVWFAMEIGESWMSPKGDTIADWTEEEIAGGHAIVFAGYRKTKDGKRQFLVHNSWGKEWGDGGYAWISEAMLKPPLLVSAYKVVVSDGALPPPPQDPQALTDDDCGEDQIVDSVTGQCANICADDSRPANGQCAGEAGRRHR